MAGLSAQSCEMFMRILTTSGASSRATWSTRSWVGRVAIMRASLLREYTASDLDQLPVASPEQHKRDHSQGELRYRNRGEHARWSHGQRFRQRPGQGQLAHPVTKKVHARGRACVAGAVEGLHQHHAPRIECVAGAEDAQAV